MWIGNSVTKSKKISLLLASALSCVVIVAPQTVRASVDDYPSRLKDALQDSISPDDWKFMNRECTSFVAWRMVNNNGFKEFNNYITGQGEERLGDATKWGPRAQAAGYAVDITPAKGAVVWWKSGHVAWVESYNTAAGTVSIEEYNHKRDGKYGTRTLDIKNDIEKKGGYFIHFKDIQDPKPATTAPTSSKPSVSPQQPTPSAPSKPASPLSAYTGTYKWGAGGKVSSFRIDENGYEYSGSDDPVAANSMYCAHNVGTVAVFDGTAYTPGTPTSQWPGIVGGVVPATANHPSYTCTGGYAFVDTGVLAPVSGLGIAFVKPPGQFYCTEKASSYWEKICGL